MSSITRRVLPPQATARELAGLVATPLASIFGSGFLIIVPVVAAVLGANAPWGVLAVCLFAWPVGSAVRATIMRVEGRDPATLPGIARVADRISTPLVIVAYVTSVALYLRVLAAYVMHLAGVDAAGAERLLVIVLIALIAAVGATRGFAGLERAEEWALYATLAVGTALPATFLAWGALHWQLVSGHVVHAPDLARPDVHVLAVLGGVLITVQGFETVRFLGDEYPAPLRIAASRIAQAVALVVYAGLSLVATPLLEARDIAPAGDALLQVVQATVPLLALPLVVVAVGSQLSAAIADTVAAVDGSNAITRPAITKTILYIANAAAVTALVSTTSLYRLVTLASQAFAAYYALTALAAAATAPRGATRAGYLALTATLAAIVVFAEPATI
jgi:hypothetical protein